MFYHKATDERGGRRSEENGIARRERTLSLLGGILDSLFLES